MPYDFVERQPVRASVTVSVGAGGTNTARLAVPAGKRYFVKQVNIAKGTNTTVTAQTFDGVETGRTASFDSETTFGEELSAEGSVAVTGSNAGTAAENLTLEILGFSVEI